MVAIALALFASSALAAPCGPTESLEAAAHGGWMMPTSRSCLYKVAARKHSRHQAHASRLLLADAQARSDMWTWKSLAESHVQLVPEDGDVWMQLVVHTQRHEHPQDVVRVTNAALDLADAWAMPHDDARVVTMHRLRTYAAIRARAGRGLDDEVVSYAKEWLAAAQDQAPAVAWELAGESPPGT